MITYNDAQVLDVTGPLEVFAIANRFIAGGSTPDGDAYRVEIVAEEPGPVTMSSGIRIVADRSWASGLTGVDTLLVSGGIGAYAASRNRALQRVLREQNTLARRIASICTGSFILAEAGLLDGKRAVTHWMACGRFAREYPKVRVEPDKIFVRDEHIYSSAGVTAGIDLALALVEEDYGRTISLEVARTLVVFMKRQGGQSQFSSHLCAQVGSEGPLQGLPEWIVENPCSDLSVESLAEKAAMSERNFSRVFTRQIGMPPARFVERVRIDRARSYLENDALTLETVAEKSGFGTAERMRRTFLRHIGVLPGAYRKRFGI
jgi:transcriptional regulator GlxA family with amidase domain